jgi:hypothetical protein
VERISAARHAIAQSRWHGALYLFVQPLLLFAVSLLGASSALLIPSAGHGGLAAHHPFGVAIMCGAASFSWTCLTAVQALHAARDTRVRRAGTALRSVAAVVSAAPLALPAERRLGSFATMLFLVGTGACTVAMQVGVNAAVVWGETRQDRSSSRELV